MTEDAAALDRALATATAVAHEAGAVMRERYLNRAPDGFAFKGRHDFITAVDGEIERLVAARLEAAFPQDGMIGEEGASRPGERLWIVDPIDGTANFARGIGHFCISIALLAGGRTVVGVIHDPMRGETFAARLGAKGNPILAATPALYDLLRIASRRMMVPAHGFRPGLREGDRRSRSR
jgi:myo-inositol-1(or 4)-monophosphatase